MSNFKGLRIVESKHYGRIWFDVQAKVSVLWIFHYWLHVHRSDTFEKADDLLTLMYNNRNLKGGTVRKQI